MPARTLRILVVDSRDRSLSSNLGDALDGHAVEAARDAFEAIYRIDGEGPEYDLIFCDLTSAELPGPELWAYLSITRPEAAARMVFVASAPRSVDTLQFLDRVPNPCVSLPAGAPGLEALVAEATERPPAGPSRSRAWPDGDGPADLHA